MRLRALVAMRTFLASWRFPTFMLSTLLAHYALLAALAFWPAEAGVLGRFAEGFRIWCLAADPSAGDPSRLATLAFLAQPIGLGLVVMLVWWEPLREVRARPRRALPYVTAALVFVAVTSALLGRLAVG
jgi:hypothetical protein